MGQAHTCKAFHQCLVPDACWPSLHFYYCHYEQFAVVFPSSACLLPGCEDQEEVLCTVLQGKIAGTLPCKFTDATSSVSNVSVRHVRLQAISVIVTHRTDDMSKLPPRLPINAPKPRSKPAQANRPKLRLNQAAQAAEAAPICPAPGPSNIGVDVVMGAEGVLPEQSGEVMGSATAAEAAADGAASPAAINAGEL